ncbi:glycerophosphoryl diester phosphodiesterase membrane domain-containing protein [Arthrobacter sp. PAMC 25486]|uniref:glycerophosphoryl diester phosphodiesterase membrane domain-containing protein n=1 Tax=Arthrobacter sp. PAMC 25486 TaxID=1494608 RepID=UPI00138DDF7F|nr:glycerophosphoryl diester phosphodiesterase membrane domain-containing protein [Arthrobacter sp. PAMC 25486]
MSTPRPRFWSYIREYLSGALDLIRQGGAHLLVLVLAMQLVVLVVVLPILRWLFKEALRANGMHGLDLGGMTTVAGLPLTLGLVALLCALAFWLLCLQFAILVVFLSRLNGQGPPTAREMFGAVGKVARKLLRPSSFPLFCYLFWVLPITGFGFTSVLIQGIAIPPFISGELYKSVASGVLLVLFLLVLGFINVRLALMVPVFALTDATGGQAGRASWRLVRGPGELVLVVSVATVLLGASVASALLMGMALIPTAVSDAIAPAASPVVAAYSLGAAQLVGLLLTGLVTAMVSAVLVVALRRSQGKLPAGLELHAISNPGPAAAGGSENSGQRRRGPRILLAAVSAGLALVLGTAALDTMDQLAKHPDTLVLAHRGFSDGGAENTVGGLEAASKAGADLVEIDVMQSRDNEYVVMHDVNLKRLTGQNVEVKDLSIAELTVLQVRDLAGHEGSIPTLSQYINRARELEMPLLIEIKLSGAEPANHVDQLVAALEALDALDTNIYHSLDKPSVERLKRLRPDLSVGYIMAFAAVDVPDTVADFIVVEEWTATPAMQHAANRAGLGFMVWTANDEERQQEYLRRDVDGIITDRPDTALSSRSSMHGESGLAPVLLDALKRFVVVF